VHADRVALTPAIGSRAGVPARRYARLQYVGAKRAPRLDTAHPVHV